MEMHGMGQAEKQNQSEDVSMMCSLSFIPFHSIGLQSFIMATKQ